MLTHLTVKNIALIDISEMDLHGGLSVFSGETGAGKSLLVDAISLLMGAKADKSLIRTGADRAYVEGVFSLADCPPARKMLQEISIEAGDEVTLSRDLTLSGRSACRVEGILLNAAQYQALTETLLDLHGQHAHQSLLNEKTHLRYLDAYGGEEQLEALRQVQAAYDSWHESEKRLETLRQREAEKEEKSLLLDLRLKELKQLNPKPGEEALLIQERDRFRSSEKLTALSDTAADSLSEGVSLMKEALGALQKAADADPSLEALSGRLNDLYYEAEDVSLEVNHFREGLHFDPEREEEVLQRLDMIKRLCRKYRVQPDDLKDLLDATKEEIQGLQALNEDLEEAQAEEKKRRGHYDTAAKRLSALREKSAGRFAAAVESQLKDLNMGSCRFQAALTACKPSRSGAETVVFLIAANAGESMHALSKTASGGELSRIMLAIKAAGATKTDVPSMVFDEIDAGISGRAAQATAEKMALISKDRQVLCVTHLQQIAAMADHQYYVEKFVREGRSYSAAREMPPDERPEEIARMLGGEKKSAMKHAAEMLAAAEKYKTSL